MLRSTKSHKTDVVFSLLIFTTFALAVLTTLMLGANFYKSMADMSQEGYDDRTSLSYVWTKAKNSDNIDTIAVGDFNGIPALLFYQVYGDTTYVTRIYPYEGWIYELFSEVGFEFLPEDGTPIIKTDSLMFDQNEGGLIRVTAGLGSVLIHPRGQEGIVRGSFD
jgi:hypothetical protein